jgi:hypothetical protein
VHVHVAILLCLAACGRTEIDRERAAKLFKEVELATKPGLSGLATDATGGLWTISERDAYAYRITLDAQNKPTLETFAIEGVPPDVDLEGIAWLREDRLALGTEGQLDDVATVLLAERRGPAFAVTSRIELGAAQIGLTELRANRGAEGVCGSGDTIIVAIEDTGTSNGKRYAPVVRISHDQIVRTHHVWLTTKTGKLSALDCSIDKDGTAHVIAIERHFSVTKLLRFSVPTTDGDITPTEVLDLGPVLNSRLNLEGIAQANDGRVYAIVDNQWRSLQGPSVLLVFEPGAVR